MSIQKKQPTVKKNFSLKTAIDTVMREINPYMDIWQNPNFQRTNSGISDEMAPPCKNGVNPIFTLLDGRIKKEHKTRKDPKKYYGAFTKHSLTRLPSDDIIKHSLKLLQNKIPVLCRQNLQQEINIFTGTAKGTERYNKKYTFKIIDFTKQIASKAGETFALTITCDPKKYNHNRINAWSNYSKDINATLENLRKNHKCKYLWVKESTAKGYPHAHILLWFPKGYCKGYSKMQNNVALKYGEFYNYVKNSVVSPVFKLCPIFGNRLKFYLTKYISKFGENAIFDLANKDGELTKSERKEVLCLLYTIVTQTRQFGFCKLDKSKEKTADKNYHFYQEKNLKKYIKKTLKKARHDKDRRIKFARLRALLISLSNNPLFSCSCRTYMSNFASFKAQFPDEDIHNISNIPLCAKKICKSGFYSGCSGCIYSMLADFLSGRSTRFVDDIEMLLYLPDNPRPLANLLPDLRDEDFCKVIAYTYELWLKHTYASRQANIVRMSRINKTYIASQSFYAAYESALNGLLCGLWGTITDPKGD